ncbi:uncharacterized protein P174DRAFT_366865 [Aspergillus novofumigatus IBT 16806]|uniref:Uncharacterized protein n=1 Tax=Aspergillus novofumigatus (strain IBT 16806) TaxID=1392255 RepID=A0A2I1CC24_ASPN1|nr:uncharacterized protein P174DRAFT_366865 [Aspergillus novofumigatus IBT 16806]PKX95177.1 hypothetical protein P174DRAFT_366865 [Aspergillus novofumigatus IBT 16806]
MHLTATLSLYSLVTLAIPVLCALPSSCTSISDFIPSKLDTTLQAFDERVCKKGCTVTIPQFEKWINSKLVSQIVTASMNEMGLSGFSTIADSISGDITKKIEDKCAAGGGETDLCQDQKAMQAIGTCLKENMMPVVLGELEQLSSFITKDMCDKMNAYLKGPELWEGVILQGLDDYASTCDKK